jgi:hypothetical protein
LGGFPHDACFTIQITRMLFAARQCDCPDVVRTAAPHTHLPEMIGTPEKGRTEPSRGNQLFLLHVVKMPQTPGPMEIWSTHQKCNLLLHIDAPHQTYVRGTPEPMEIWSTRRKSNLRCFIKGLHSSGKTNHRRPNGAKT